MVRNEKQLRKWEMEWLKSQPSNYLENLHVFEALYQEAMALGALPLKNPLEGLELKIQLARTLHVSRPA